MNFYIFLTTLFLLTSSSPLPALDPVTLALGGMTYTFLSPIINRLEAETSTPLARKAGQYLTRTWLNNPDFTKSLITHLIPATANLHSISAFQASFPIIMVLDGIAKEADKSPRKTQEFVYLCKQVLIAFKTKVETGKATLALEPIVPLNTNLGWNQIPYWLIEALYLKLSWPYTNGIKIDALAQGITNELLKDPSKAKELVECFIEAFYKEYPNAVESVDGIFHMVPGSAWSKFMNRRTGLDPVPTSISERLEQSLGYLDEIIVNLGKSADALEARDRDRQVQKSNVEMARWVASEDSWIKPSDLKPGEDEKENLVQVVEPIVVPSTNHERNEGVNVNVVKKAPPKNPWIAAFGGKSRIPRQNRRI